MAALFKAKCINGQYVCWRDDFDHGIAATKVHVTVSVDMGHLHLSVSDNGVGGAVLGGDSGRIGAEGPSRSGVG